LRQCSGSSSDNKIRAKLEDDRIPTTPGVIELLAVMNKLRSPDFKREMQKLEKQLRRENNPKDGGG
jgi:hypothetical protein